MKKVWNAFEHQLYAWLKDKGWLQHRFLLSVSGGVDSMAMAESFSCLLPAENLAVLYVHHGPHESLDQQHFRNQSLLLVEKFCLEKNVRFFSKISEGSLSSEAEMRDFRLISQQIVKSEIGFDFVTLAHHQDDQVETQILHLIRGCGLQGLMAMQETQGDVLRPFLKLTKQDFYAYAKERNIRHIEDPSNRETDYLRNWVRQSWLPALDHQQMGLKQSFMNSLLQISREVSLAATLAEDWSQGLSRLQFMAASRDEKKSLVYRYLKALEVPELNQGQIEEIVKRLDKSQNELTFRMSHSEWTANAQYIVARKKVANP